MSNGSDADGQLVSSEVKVDGAAFIAFIAG
jgi:hypothetical protein